MSLGIVEYRRRRNAFMDGVEGQPQTPGWGFWEIQAYHEGKALHLAEDPTKRFDQIQEQLFGKYWETKT